MPSLSFTESEPNAMSNVLALPKFLFAVALNPPGSSPIHVLLKLNLAKLRNSAKEFGDRYNVVIESNGGIALQEHVAKFSAKKLTEDGVIDAIDTGFYATSPLQAWRNFAEGCDATAEGIMSKAVAEAKPYQNSLKHALKVINELEDEVRLNAAALSS